MTNCQPAPTKARLKCQHRMTKGPRGSSETNCVQYELILYIRAGPAGCWLLAARPRERPPPPAAPGGPSPCGDPRIEALGGPQGRGGPQERGWHKLGRWDAECRAQPCSRCHGFCPRCPVGTVSGTTRAAVKTLPTKKGSCRKISPLLLHPESRASASAHRAGPQRGFIGSMSFHQPDNRCLIASAQPLDPGAANSPGGGACFVPLAQVPRIPWCGGIHAGECLGVRR